MRDNGPGIPDSVKEPLFEPFFTTKGPGEGTGLGLSICFRILEAQGASIHVESDGETFTEFRIVIPISSKFEAIFGNLAPIYLASSPEEGFEVFEKNHYQIGIVVSDKKMPNESGLSLLERMQALDPKPLRFLVTAFSNLDIAVDALNDGLLYSYLTKPWDPDELAHRLSKAMSDFRLAREREALRALLDANRHGIDFRPAREREALLREKAIASQQILMAEKAASIGILSAGLRVEKGIADFSQNDLRPAGAVLPA